MKKLISVVLVLLTVSACAPVTVPPAHKGKFLTSSGYQPEVLEAGKYWEGMRENLVLIETQTGTYTENVKVILQDKLTLHVEVRFRWRIDGSEAVINAMFNDILAGSDDRIVFNDVYGVYGRMAVQNKTREIVSKYNVDEVHKNYARLSGEISKALIPALANTPLEISDVAVGNIQYPNVVTQAIEQAEERSLAIAKEQAQAEIEMTKKENERLLAEADYQVRITKAKAVRDENLIVGEGVTKELLELKRLEVAQALAANSNESSKVFLPIEALTTVGANVDMLKSN